MTGNSAQVSDLTARRFFLLLLIAATVLLGAVIRPIAYSLTVAAVLGGVLWPLHQKLTKHMRNRRAPSAALLVVGILILMLVPLAGLSAFVLNEGEQGIRFISDTLRSERVNEWIERMVVGLIDNAVKPLILKGGMHISGAVVFFALVGGLAAFGIMGLLLGPLVVSLFLALLRMYQRDFGSREAEAQTPPA